MALSPISLRLVPELRIFLAHISSGDFPIHLTIFHINVVASVIYAILFSYTHRVQYGGITARVTNKPLPTITKQLPGLATLPPKVAIAVSLDILDSERLASSLASELMQLFQSPSVSTFTNNSDAFWSLIVDTNFWSLFFRPDEARSTGALLHRYLVLSEPSRHMFDHFCARLFGWVPNSLSEPRSPLMSLAADINRSFQSLVSAQNSSIILSVLRMIASYQVLTLTLLPQPTTPSLSTGGYPSLSSLTGLFSFWGAIHSISSSPQLLDQVRGLLYWFTGRKPLSVFASWMEFLGRNAPKLPLDVATMR
jgi:hypothetical protein